MLKLTIHNTQVLVKDMKQPMNSLIFITWKSSDFLCFPRGLYFQLCFCLRHKKMTMFFLSLSFKTISLFMHSSLAFSIRVFQCNANRSFQTSWNVSTKSFFLTSPLWDFFARKFTIINMTQRGSLYSYSMRNLWHLWNCNFGSLTDRTANIFHPCSCLGSKVLMSN